MSWEKVKFGTLYAIESRNGLTKPSRVRGSGFKMINMGELFANDRIYDIPMELVPLNDSEKINAKVEKDDLLFARQSLVLKGAGKCCIVMDVSPLTVFESHIIRVRLNKEAYPLFYYYYFRSGLSPIKTIVNQCAQAGIRASDLEKLDVICPPIKTQHKIASILSAYDDLIENHQKQIALLEEAARRLYREWFVALRFPGHETTPITDGIPEGWKKGTLNDIAEDFGVNENKKNRELYAYYLPIDCLPKKSLTYLEWNNIEMAESSLVSFRPNDILFGAMRPYFHKVAIARDNGLTRSTCFVINAKKQIYWSYLVMLLFSEDTINYATTICVGTTMPYARWKDFIQMPIIIPTKDIAQQFSNFFDPITKKLAKLAKQITLLSEARDRLLPRLMREGGQAD